MNLFNTSTLEGYSRYIRIEQGGIWGYYEITGEFQTLKMQILTQSSTYDLSVAIVGTTLFIIIIGMRMEPY